MHKQVGLLLVGVFIGLALHAPAQAAAAPAPTITEYPVPTPNSGPVGITAGPDGAMWFTEQAVGKIGRVTTSGAFTEFSTPGVEAPLGITSGPDGALWFTEPFANKIVRVTTSGAFTEYPIPTQIGRCGSPTTPARSGDSRRPAASPRIGCQRRA